MNKQFTNKELKTLIINLYNENNIVIEDNLKNQLLQSSKTTYIKLDKYYNEIKLKISELLISINSSKNLTEEIEKIEIQIDYNEIKELKTENFNQRQTICKLKFKLTNLKLEYKKTNKKVINCNISNLSTSDEEEDKFIEKRKYNYQELTELSSYNIINELQKLSHHNLKQIYNRYFSNKLKRQI